MKVKSLLPILLLGFVAWAPATPKIDLQPNAQITGDYVEARTASVFAGACHYNGELVTEGREAILAWSFSAGSWKGVDLTGVRAMAEVASDANLIDNQVARKCELVIDSSASDAQAAVVIDLLRTRDGNQLGEILPTHRSTISFQHDGQTYVVNANGFAALTVRAMPNNECCTQPHLVWYTPLMALQHRKVGYTQLSSYLAGTLGDSWQRSDENSAFYGSFVLKSKF